MFHHPKQKKITIGWTIIQEAIAGKNIPLLKGLLNQVKIDLNKKFEERIPQAIRALDQVNNI